MRKSSPMGNDLHLVKAVVGELADHGFDVAVFGGWAEELLGVAPPWQHRDIDLMLYLNDLQQLDRFVGLRGEVEAKRYSHKRAFVQAGTLVELFLAVREDGD